MYDKVIELIKVESSVDDYGNTQLTETSKSVFAEAKSVGMREWYEAKVHGVRPEGTFELADYADYDGEQLLRYKNTTYDIERTYQRSRRLELVVTKRGG